MTLPALMFIDLVALGAALALTWALPDLRLGFVGAYGCAVTWLLWCEGETKAV